MKIRRTLKKTVTESLNLPIATADGATVTPKPIMIPYSEDVKEIIRKFAQDCDKKFYVKTVGCWVKLFADSLPIKENVIEFLINNEVQLYFTPDTRALLKAVIWGLPTWFKTEDIKYALQGEEFEIIKIAQMISKKDKRALPLFQIHLPNDEQATNIFKGTRIHYFGEI